MNSIHRTVLLALVFAGSSHAAERNPRGGDDAVIEGQVEGGAHGADVVVQPF